VRREIGVAIAQNQLPPRNAIRKELTGPTLELLIDRRVVLDALRRDRRAASDADVELELARAKAALARIQDATAERSRSLDDDHPLAQQYSDADLRFAMDWRLSWRRLCEAELTDDAVAAYFEKHRRQFDGSRLRVSHILFSLSKNADEKAAAEAIERAAKLRQRIVAGEISFADAAKQFSDAPSKADGGDIGEITRRGEQHDAFASVAFALAIGEISSPTRTPHGVHLIRCAAEQPGDKKLADVREAVVRAATTELFRTRADEERPKAKIVYADHAAAASDGD
jgi:parvulin-like peptidyl-prolyl isomerase